MVESMEKISAMARLQKDCEAKIARGAKREKELLSSIESELACRAAIKIIIDY